MTETHTTTPTRVVLVDDAEEIRVVFRLALDREADFEIVAEAADGEEAVEAVRTHQPDLVLLDIAMPTMDGLQALRVIREESPGAVVIMLSGFSETVAAVSAVELGAHGYIRKGGRIPELLAHIRDVLEHRSHATERAAGRAGEASDTEGS